MTREEAIKELERAFDVLDHSCHMDARRKEAFNMARVALYVEPSIESVSFWCRQHGYVMMSETVYEQEITKAYFEGQNAEPCENAISRQAAQDYIAEYLSQYLYDDVRAAVEVIDEYIGDLPSVTPKQKMGRWIKEKQHHKDDFQEFDYWDVRCSECGARKRIGWTNVRHCPMCGAKMAESEDTE